MAREDRQMKRAKRKKAIVIWSVVFLVLILMIGGIYAETIFGDGKVRDFVMEVVPVESEASAGTVAENTITIGENTSSQIIPFGEKFLLTTKDGVKYYNSIGDQKWSDTFTMENPQTIYEGDYVAIGDMNGRSIRVYNQVGLVYTLQLDGSPIQFELNANGYLSVIYKTQDEYYVRVYNGSGTLLKGRVEAAAGTYPLFSDVADDNKTFCVTYLNTSDMKMVSKVLFFYINPGDSEAYTDSMFAGVEMEDEVITKVKYMNDDTVVAISEQKLYAFTTAGVESWNMVFENRIKMCDFSNKGYGVLVLGEVLPNAEGEEVGTILMMSNKGKETGRYQMDDVSYLRASDTGVVVGDGKTFAGLSYKGKEEWLHQVSGSTKDVLTMNSLNRVMFVGTLEAGIYTLRGSSVEEEVGFWVEDDLTEEITVETVVLEDVSTEEIPEDVTSETEDALVE